MRVCVERDRNGDLRVSGEPFDPRMVQNDKGPYFRQLCMFGGKYTWRKNGRPCTFRSSKAVKNAIAQANKRISRTILPEWTVVTDEVLA